MSTNCLVTKLKSVVNNDTLPFMNGLHIWIAPQPDTSKLYPIVVKDVSEKCPVAWENGITVYSDGVAYSSPKDIPFGNGTYTITNTTDSYKLLTLKNTKNLKYFNLPLARGIKEELMQLDGLTGGYFMNIRDLNDEPIYYSADWVNRALANNTETISIFIDDLNRLNAGIFSNQNASVNRTISFNGDTSLPAITTGDITRFTNIVCRKLNINDSKITGDIKNLKLSSSCNALSMFRSYMTGDIIEFVPAMINRGLTSGIDLGYFASTDAYTFNGNHPSIASPTLYWESASKIFIKNTRTKDIYCYGYTDSEITERRSSDPLWTDTTNVTKMD